MVFTRATIEYGSRMPVDPLLPDTHGEALMGLVDEGLRIEPKMVRSRVYNFWNEI